MPRGDLKRRLLPLVPAIIVAVATFLWLGRTNPPVFPINDDGIRDQLLARDCAELGHCHLLGASASFGGFYQGAVWIDLLTAVALLGGDLDTQRTAVLACLAVTVALLVVVVWHWLRPSLAVPAAAFLLATLTLDRPASLLINPSIAIFPDLLTTAGLLCYGLSRQRRFLWLAAFSLGVAMSTHTASLSLLVPFLIITSLARPRAWRDVLLAVTLAGLVYGIPSSAALRANILALAAHGRLLPAVLAPPLIVALALPLGPRFRGLSWERRACAIGAILLGPFVLIALWLVVWQRHHFSVIYLHPILAPGVVAAAALVALPFDRPSPRMRVARWIPTVLAGAYLALLTVRASTAVTPSAAAAELWDLRDAEMVAEYVAQRGWAYDDLVFHLQGNACRELLAGMSVFAPAPRALPVYGRRQLQVVKAPHAAFRPEHDVVPLGANAVLLREVESWLRFDAGKGCRARVGSAQPPLCHDATMMAPAVQPANRFLFIKRSFYFIESLAPLDRPYIATYEIPLAATQAGRRELAVTDDHAAPCGWRIARVDGVQTETALPARRVILHTASPATGTIVFEKPFGTEGCPLGEIDTYYPPCVLETPAADTLHDLVGRP